MGKRGIASGKLRGTGNGPCDCRDCMEISMGGMCHDCEAAGCDGTGECDSPDAYGMGEQDDPGDRGR